MISCKELSTLGNPVVLKDHLMSTYKYVVNLLSYLFGSAIPSLAMQLWSLVQQTCNSQLPGSCTIQEERPVSVPSIRTMGPTQFVANFVIVIEVIDDIECVPREALI